MEETMDPTRFEAMLRSFAASAGRRDAVRSLGAVGLGALAALGLSGDADGAKGKRRQKRRERNRNQKASAPGGAGVEAKQKKKKPKPGPAGAAGPAGPTGPTGLTGPTGAIGADSTVDNFENAQLQPILNETATLNPKCPNVNSKVLGGGFDTGVSGGVGGEVTVNAAFPTEGNFVTPEGFQVEVTRTGTLVQQNILVTAFVKCTA
jgi:hypothetical protein